MTRKKAKNFNDFQDLAKQESLDSSEVVDFPSELRAGFEQNIILDLESKLPKLNQFNSKVLDIGSGCGQLTLDLIENTFNKSQELHLVDGIDVLNRIPTADHVIKHFGKFENIAEFENGYDSYFDIIICYSTFQYIYSEFPINLFLERALKLLNNQGMLLIGDIPNKSMRDRMLSSEYGQSFHKNYTQTDSTPAVKRYDFGATEIDDSIIFSLLMRARNLGYQSYCLPQNANLAFANRREDILIVKY